MPDFPVLKNIDPIVISSATPQSLGEAWNSMGIGTGSLAWGTTNQATFMPVSIFSPITIRKMFIINGATASGNVDVGIYDRGGGKMVSIGSTAQVGVSVIQEFDIADTILNPGLYYLACALDNTTGAIEGWGPTGAIPRSLGIQIMTSAFPLPATATLAAISGTVRHPFIGATQRAVV